MFIRHLFLFVKQIPLIYLLVCRPKNFWAALALCPTHLGSPESSQADKEMSITFSVSVSQMEKKCLMNICGQSTLRKCAYFWGVHRL